MGANDFETLNMMGVTVETFTEEIKDELEDENYDPIIGIGKSGVGKTMSIYELTQKLGIGFKELRLVTLTEVDLLGIPVIEDGKTTYASNALLPDAERDGERGVLVLDEITSATSTIRAAAYQLLDSKRALGNYKLPDGWKVVALGNGPSDGGVFQGMESAFLSRAFCYRIEPDFATWKRWAINNGVNPAVIAYLQSQPDKLHKLSDDGMASIFPCPRSWTALSKKLNAREAKNNGKLSPEKAELYAAGAIGVDEAPQFSAFYGYSSEALDASEIIAGKNPDAKGIRSEAIYIAIQQIVKLLVPMITSSTSKGNIPKESIEKTANAFNWVIGLGRLDYVETLKKDLTDSEGSRLVTQILFTDEFDELCPGFMELSESKSKIFDINNRA